MINDKWLMKRRKEPTTSPSLTLGYSSFPKEESFPTHYFPQNFPSFWKEGCPQGGVVGFCINH
jgi:hypothetical protein